MTHILKSARLLSASALGLLALALPAEALDATADTWLNVRDAPNNLGEIVDTLAPGESVSVEECDPGGWCWIEHSGPDGWVNSDYISPTSGAGSSPADPNCRFQLTIGASGPELTITCGDSASGGGGSGGDGGGVPDPDPSPDPTADPNRVCFFDGPNFTDESICREVGTYNTLGPVNDRITSIQLHGDAKVRLCERQNMGPYCRDVTASEGRLGQYLNNEVSSFRVYTGTLPRLKQACFFDGDNYTGDHYCLRVGTRNRLGDWNDRVRSVAVFGGAEVTVCTDTNMGPLPDGCHGFDSNQANFLAPFTPDSYGISSVRVR